ncbi:tetraacyldisaccharide 4'-kinase [Pelagibaculum spongiae]|uniref:Tetraacyldisaccharide 4'-kinase n=1 Tax=Pelagibaculum spongiae TaxID=2080658 RepID=A0A2V1GXA3_9GAMM|nr:tetraacyldisaccharide 4'-kinase [Pelagibaculum spongiae]PVZ68894.1 tetraacyldisaccharide 4'-kinase [Pelagibaculum spongiae]
MSKSAGDVLRRWLEPVFLSLWYQDQNKWLGWLLKPLSHLFDFIVCRKRHQYLLGKKTSFAAGVPTIVVGNLTAGGAGKTPLTLWLIDWAKDNGFNPGVVSRGYGSSSDQLRLVDEQSTAADVGDEPLMMFLRGQTKVAVGRDRVAVAKLLVAQGCDLLICDDGLQHYRLARDIEIAVIDGQRRFGNQKMLPAGPLREPVSRLDSVDFVVCNGSAGRSGEFEMQLQPGKLQPLHSDETALAPQLGKVLAVAGIGNPQRFHNTLTQLGFSPELKALPDHHHYQLEDLSPNDALPLLMTEKDAVKCRHLERPNSWYLPVTAKLSNEFSSHLKTKLAEVTHG